jgi:thiamine kinase-like enzyme
MDKAREIVVIRDDLERHPALVAWTRVQRPVRQPTSIEILKRETPNSAVYRLRGVGPSGLAVIAKRRPEGDLETESRLYADVFPRLPLPAICVYGVLEAHEGHSWLFLEDCGDEWYTPKVEEHRQLAVDWLATLHTASARSLPWLPRTGSTFYFAVLRTAQREVRRSLGHHALSPENVATLDRILRWLHRAEERWHEFEAACADSPESLVHGDFLPKNVRIRRRRGRLELVAFDWETSGWATPAADLALLPGGRAQLRAYHRRIREAGSGLRGSDLARLRALGRLYRLINSVYWETRSFEYDWIVRAMRHMELYESRLKEAVEADLISGGSG